MLTLFVTLGMVGALSPAVVASDPSCNKNENPKSGMYTGSIDKEPAYRVPTNGHFHIWNLVSAGGDSLLEFSQDKGQLVISCSGSFSQDPVKFHDTTIYPTASLSMTFQAPNQGSYFLSIHQDTKEVVAKRLQAEDLNDNERLIGWPYQGFAMFESKLHPNHFLGCTKEGDAQLFQIHNKRYPDPRILFVLKNVVPNS